MVTIFDRAELNKYNLCYFYSLVKSLKFRGFSYDFLFHPRPPQTKKSRFFVKFWNFSHPKITYFGHITMPRSSAIYFYLIKGRMRVVGLYRHPVMSAVLAKIPPTINLLNRDLYRVDNYPAILITSSAVTSANKLAVSFFSVLHICADNPWSSQRRSFSRPPRGSPAQAWRGNRLLMMTRTGRLSHSRQRISWGSAFSRWRWSETPYGVCPLGSCHPVMLGGFLSEGIIAIVGILCSSSYNRVQRWYYESMLESCLSLCLRDLNYDISNSYWLYC